MIPDAEITVRTLADGGEGTTGALVTGLNGSYRSVTVSDPLGRPITARYGILPDTSHLNEQGFWDILEMGIAVNDRTKDQQTSKRCDRVARDNTRAEHRPFPAAS